MSYLINWTTPSPVRKHIVHAELIIPGRDLRTINLYLDMSRPIDGQKGVQFGKGHTWGDLRDDAKFLREHSCPSQTDLARKYNISLVHCFCLGKPGAPTSQKIWFGNLAVDILNNYGLDILDVNGNNLLQKNQQLQLLLQNKELECNWSRWSNGRGWFYGPDGNHLRIV